MTGTLGRNGWYVSDVGLTWSVVDSESAITSQTGCDSAAVTADTTGQAFTCSASSQHTAASSTVTIRRDATPPGLACVTPAPVFELGQQGALVSAAVSDATSGPSGATAIEEANTASAGAKTVTITGFDLAGNQRSVSCGYQVTVPACQGYTPTILGTAGPDAITGTAGRDVILALGGNDTISGLGGDDIICAGDGYDLVYGGLGNDLIDGGDGNDTVWGEAGKDTIFGMAGNDSLDGGDGDDTIDGGDGTDAISGQGGKDRCTSGEVRMSSCIIY